MPDVMVVIENLDEPGRLADIIVSNLGLKVEPTQEIWKSKTRLSDSNARPRFSRERN